MIEGRPEWDSGRVDVTMSVTVLQLLKMMSVAQRAENCESRFIHAVCNYREITPTPFGFNRSVTCTPFFRALITNVLFSPKIDHGPRDTSLKSTNRQSVTSVCFRPR